MNLKLISLIFLIVIIYSNILLAEESKIVFQKSDGSYSSFDISDIETIEFDDITTKNKIRFYKLGNFDEFYVSNITDLNFNESKLMFKYGVNDFQFNLFQIDSMVIYESTEPFYNFVNFNMNYQYIENYRFNSEVFIDTVYKYYTDLGCANLGLTNLGFDIQFKDFINNQIKVEQLSIEFADGWNTIENNRYGDGPSYNLDFRIENEKSEILYDEVHEVFYKMDIYNDLNENTKNIRFINNKIEFEYITKNKLDNYFLIFNGADSLRHTNVKQNEVLVYFKDKVILLPNIYYQQELIELSGQDYDSTHYETRYIIKDNKIGFYVEGLNDEYLYCFKTSYEKLYEDYQEASYIEAYSENFELNDSILFTGDFKTNQRIQFKIKNFYNNDYLRLLEIGKIYEYPTKMRKMLYSQVFDFTYFSNELISNEILTTCDLSDKIEYINSKPHPSFNNYFSLFKTNCVFNGKNIQYDSTDLKLNFNKFLKNNHIFIASSNFSHRISAVYFNLIQSNINYTYDLNIKDFYIDNFDIRFPGSILFESEPFNLHSKKDEYFGKSKQKGVLLQFNYFTLGFANIAFFGSETDKEITHFNSIMEYYDKENEGFIVSGFTSSTSLFEQSKRSKTTQDIDNLIFKIDYRFDSVFTVKYFGGPEDEAVINNYQDNNNFLFENENGEYVFWGITKSKEFNNLGNEVIKNSKSNETFDVFAANLDKNFNIKKLMYIESNTDDILNDVIFYPNQFSMENGFLINIGTKSNSLIHFNSQIIENIDTISLNTKYQKCYIAFIDEKLFKNDQNIFYEPVASTYIESDFFDITCTRPFITFGSPFNFDYRLNFGINTKSNLIFNNFKYNLNNGSNNIYNDGFFVKFIFK